MGLHDLMMDSVAYALDPERENVILLHSDRYQLVRLAIPHIVKLQEEGYRIRLISHFSWTKEDLGVPVVYTSLFSSNASLEAYDAQWRTYFSEEHVSEAPRYDLLGYDLTRALIMQLQQCTRQSNEQLTEECMSARIKGIQSDIMFRRVSEQGGRINAAVNVLRTDKEP
jgi:hypothetical protein